jgi:hypothetical protein
MQRALVQRAAEHGLMEWMVVVYVLPWMSAYIWP